MLSSLYHAGLRAELTRRLGVEWKTPEHGLAEMVGVPNAVLEEFSQRAAQVDARLAVKLDRFRESLGREPTARERWRLGREVAVDSRGSKPAGRLAVGGAASGVVGPACRAGLAGAAAGRSDGGPGDGTHAWH